MYDHQDSEICLIGNHPHPGPGRCCTRHLDRIRDQLAGVAAMTGRLPAQLVPGSPAADPGQKVATSRVGSPTPANLAVLSLLAPGGREIRRDARMLAPQVRRWTTTSTYDVTVIRDGQPVTERKTLPTWHSEIVTDGYLHHDCRCGTPHRPQRRPVLRMDDDQVGLIPPAEWLDSWVRRWRIALHHTRSPLKARVSLACDADQARRLHRATTGERLRAARRSPALMPAVAQLIVLQRLYEQQLAADHAQVRAALLGIRHDGPDHQQRVDTALHPTGALTPGRTEHDAVAAGWAVRFGATQTAAAVQVDAAYLAEWAVLAADTDHPDVDLPAFAAELAALHAELQHVLGYTSDEQWIGRCPTQLRDLDGTDTDRVCGYGLWHDPYRTRIECPRCHSFWDQREWLPLARLIRTKWPIDRRRRYTQTDRDLAEAAHDYLPHCHACDEPLTIGWKEVTGRGRDTTPYWTPATLTCPDQCLTGTALTPAAAA
ncbi:hypothetical protein [Actinoplanes sp. NBRC 101535]|uniref:hypothetical protein n=1 Tax=Actinoplanes sp. NBRC 101535 TaxID=3032196 RepID=UPI0024A50970|nr:hypothetical protein [Actinoplanes sp. NBRC 101535]GLY08221.1 hypothetical protein Acsp01_86000 [Actinoplanes sp. NBRC 101535]